MSFQEISPSDFFYRNRDLAGFSNPSRALYSALRELVENSLDACDSYGILPEIYIKISQADNSTSDIREYELSVQDNGIGMPDDKIPMALGKVFYGTKFGLKQARGTFGMGATMSVLYAQITTNKPVCIDSSQDGVSYSHYELFIDIERNKPIIINHSVTSASGWRGTRVRMNLVGDYMRSATKVKEYIKRVAIVTPYANILFIDPTGEVFMYRRTTTVIPPAPVEVKPHPKGVDLEMVRRMVRVWKKGNMVSFLTKNFHRVGKKTAISFLQYAGIDPNTDPRSLTHDDLVKLESALRNYDKFLPPDASCLSPIGRDLLMEGIRKELNPEFIDALTRTPLSYEGYPFIIEVAVSYENRDGGMRLFRYANRIPLLYDEGNDVAYRVLNEEIDWKRYHLTTDDPVTVITHICSTKVPYKTMGKEYVADRPEVEREIRNALRIVLRSLSIFINRKSRMEVVKKKQNIYRKYLPLIARFSSDLAERRIPDVNKLISMGEEEVEIQERVDGQET